MPTGTPYNQRNIVLAPFTFSDLSAKKQRPVLIISNEEYNRNNDDFLCCAITSNPREYHQSLEILPKDMEEGNLQFISRIKPGKLHTISKGIILRKIGKLSKNKSREVVKNLDVLISIDEP